jgi:hypothetical protein
MSEQFKILRPWIPVEKLYWKSLSVNPAAIHLLEQNPDKINWEWLSANPAAIHLISKALEQNPDKIDWDWLSKNPAAIHLLEQNQDKIYWPWLSQNPAIFTYDYKKIAEHRWPINKEIIQNRFHPKNMKYFSGWGIEEFDDYEE